MKTARDNGAQAFKGMQLQAILIGNQGAGAVILALNVITWCDERNTQKR